MATTKKKTTTKKAAPKKTAFKEEDKRALWLALTVGVALVAYFIFEYFA